MSRNLSILTIALFLIGCALNKASSQVAFIGDSITEGWAFPRVNYGVHGNTTAQMLARFPQQILTHPYKTVHILGGTNDVLLHIPPETTIRNLDIMIELAQSHNIEPIVGEIPPILLDHGAFSAAVLDLDNRIRNLAALRHVAVVNYYDVIAGRPDAIGDGVHLKRRGYAVMEGQLLSTRNVF
ncbi:MAG: hypothetical protein JOY95_02025 [Silvibacterium sp.]|nr:hypothetical protein [Silvibacterium sp.]